MNSLTYDINSDCTLARSMRRIRQHWPLAYSKLLALDWQTTSSTPYGATDGKRLLLNPAGITAIEATSDAIGHCAFLLVHEALHALLSHGSRLSTFSDKQTANVAADYIINAMIVRRNKEVYQQSAGKLIPFPLIENVLIDEALSGDKSVDQLYRELSKAQPEQPKQQPQPQDDDDADDSDADDSDAGDSDADADAGDDGADADAGDSDADDSGDASADGSSDDGDSAGAGAGAGKQTDADILGSDWVGAGSDDTLKPEADADAGMTEEDVAREIDDANENIILAEQLNSRAGMIGSSGTREISALRTRRDGLDWCEYLKQWLTARCTSGWDKPFNAPIYTSTGLVSAGRQRKAINELAVVIDTSCSVPQTILAEMLDAVQDALDTLKPDAIHLISADHKVQQHVELRVGDKVPMALKGGGGTLFKPAFDWIEENAPFVDGLVYLTDGDAYDWQMLVEPTYPVLWLDYGRHPEYYKFGERVTVAAR